ncbi:MAG: glycine zipper 2TM domain-containing protein [Planctomycetes bacterium]|nr:glycine zipper 2TM domain-containing protein [Planctomycetota bacterium]
MRWFAAVCLLFAACSTPTHLSRDEARPFPAPARSAPVAVAPRVSVVENSQPVDEAATQAWLQQQIERRRAENPEPEPIYRYVEQIVEHPVYVERPVYPSDPYSYRGLGWDECGEPVYVARRRWHHAPDCSPFPIHTALGAGIGAIIGHQSHHRDRGALIGGGLGLLLDLGRWCR